MVLTAAHCKRADRNTVRYGSHDLKWRSGVQHRRVERWVGHPSFDSADYDNDVALLLLSEPFDNVRSSRLHTPMLLLRARRLFICQAFGGVNGRIGSQLSGTLSVGAVP